MILTENQQKWSNIISEELHVTDQNKLRWMSQYAVNHEIKEGLQTGSVDGGIYATPLNTLGMGNPMMPQANNFAKTTGIGNTGADFHSPDYQVGSGDIPMSTLTMSLEIAATTIGFELVPVIPAPGPWAMLSYMDFPYAGGKLGRINETALDGIGDGAENKPIYIKINVKKSQFTTVPDVHTKVVVKIRKPNAAGTGHEDAAEFTGLFLGFSRIDGYTILEVKEVVDANNNNISIAEAFGEPNYVKKIQSENGSTVYASLPDTEDTDPVVYGNPNLVTGMADHIQGFSNFYDGDDDPMTRAQNETGVGNTIGARMFTKLVQMGAYEVTGTVTRQQLQDMPLYGVDVVGQVLEAMQNEISQAINNRILDRVFKLGVENYKTQKEYQNVDLNLYFGPTASSTKNLNAFAAYKKFVGIDGQTVPNTVINNATQNTAAETVTTHQRRIMSRVLAAANLIANVSRRGRANWVVTNTQILSALQDSAAFVVAPMANTLTQDGSESLYFAGSVAGLNLYVDPYMPWDDTRVCVGRKSDGKTPGVVFMPYILADTVQTIVEGTMAPKLLVNSRYALVDAGFYPEQNYYTFMVDTDGIGLI